MCYIGIQSQLQRKVKVGHDLTPTPSAQQKDDNLHKLEVGSTVQYGDPPRYGVVKWMGVLPDCEEVVYVGLEMVSFL